MPTLTELARLGKQALLAFVAQVLTEFAALKTRVEELLAELAALNARVAELLGENAALKAQLEQRTRDAKRQAAPFSKGQRTAQPKCPRRKPGQGHFTFRTLPRLDQWTASPIEVPLPEPICPCCGETLQEQRVDFAAITEIPPQPSADRAALSRLGLLAVRPVTPPCGRPTRTSPPISTGPPPTGWDLARWPRRTPLHYGLGVPVRKVPAVLHLYTGVRLTQSAITQDASRSRRRVRSVGSIRPSATQVPTSDVALHR